MILDVRIIEDGALRGVVTLPLRIGACATRLGLRVTDHAINLGLSAAARLIEAAVPGNPQGSATDDWEIPRSVRSDIVAAPPPSTTNIPPTPGATARDPTAEVSPAPAKGTLRSTGQTHPPEATSTAEVRAATIPEFAPVHVSEQPQFVEAFAEPGAEEGAGATVHVREPRTAYRQTTANEIIGRLADASPEELAGVALYQGRHQGRRTGLTAAERQLRRNGNDSRKQ